MRGRCPCGSWMVTRGWRAVREDGSYVFACSRCGRRLQSDVPGWLQEALHLLGMTAGLVLMAICLFSLPPPWSVLAMLGSAFATSTLISGVGLFVARMTEMNPPTR